MENMVEARLFDYIRLVREVENTIERLARMCASMQSPASASLTGMPIAGQSDKISRQMAIREELEEKLRQMQCAERTEYHRLEGMVASLIDPDERQVIRLYYFDLLSWVEVASVMFGIRPDCDENTERYLRRVHRLRVRALEHLEVLNSAGDI